MFEGARETVDFVTELGWKLAKGKWPCKTG